MFVEKNMCETNSVRHRVKHLTCPISYGSIGIMACISYIYLVEPLRV